MAKKKLTGAPDDDYEDFDFDFGDFDTAPPPPPTGREAVKAAATGAVKGIKDTVLNKGNIERTIRSTLPEGYGEAKDLFDQTKYSVENTWREAVETLKPLESQLKSLNEKIIPKIEGIAPEKLMAQLRKFTNERKSRTEEEDTRSVQNEEMLAEIFKQQEVAESARQERGDKRMDLEQGLAQLRHKDISSFLGQIAESTTRLSQYQDNVLMKYQRQSLKIALQHYGIAADTLALMKQANADTQDKLASIVHNSSLPDFQKTRLNEAAQQQARDALIEGVRKSLLGDTTSYISRFTDHAGKKLRDSLKGMVSGAGTALSMGGMVLDDDPFGPKEDNFTAAGRTAGSFLANRGMQAAGNLAKKALGKDKRVTGMGANLQYRVMNAGADFHDFMKKASDGSLGGDIRAFLGRTFAPDMVSNVSVDTERLSDLQQAKAFSGLDSKSIREVIPGYLSAILQQLTMLRTGQDAPRMIFDHNSGSFKTDKQFKNSMVDSLLGNSRQGSRDRATSLIESIDRGGRLSEQEREQAIKTLIASAMDGKNTDIKTLSDPNHWGEGEGAKNIANVFSRFIRTGKDGKRLMTEGNMRRQIYVTGTVNSMASGIGNPVERIQELVKAGYTNELKQAGLISETGVINRDMLKRVVSMDDDQYLDEFNHSRVNFKKTKGASFGEALSIAKKHKLDEKASGMINSVKGTFNKLDPRELLSSKNLKEKSSAWLASFKASKESLMEQASTLRARLTDPDMLDRIDSVRKAIEAAKDPENLERMNAILADLTKRANSASGLIKNAGISAVASLGTVAGVDTAAKPEIQSDGDAVGLKSPVSAFTDKDEGQAIRDTQAQARAPTSVSEVKEAMMGVIQENVRSMRELFGVKDGQTVTAQMGQSTTAGSDSRMIYDVLVRIEEILKSNLSVTSSLAETMSSTAGAQMQALLNPPERNVEVKQTKSGDGFLMNVRTSIGSKSYTSLLEHARDSAKATFSKVSGSIKDFATRHKDRFFGGLNFVKGIGTRIKNSALYAAARSINSLAPVVGDVYVGAELSPRMTAGGIRAGKYFDKATQKPITTLASVSGDVIDDEGNTVLLASEIDSAYIGGTVRQALRDVTKKGLKGVIGIGDMVSRFTPRAVNTVVDGIKSAIAKVKKMLPPFDVYVEGQGDTPVLYATKFRLGVYFSKKTSLPLRHPRDIDGPVIDSDGNYVVTEEQIELGLVDINGAPVGSPVARMFGKIGATVHRGLGFLTALGRGAANLAGTVLGGLKDYFKDIFTPFTEVISNSKKSLEVMTKIYELLDERMPGGKKVLGDMNGDGIRDGSIEDIRAKRAAKEQAEAAKKQGIDVNNFNFKNSIFGKMAGLLGGLFGGKKKSNDDDDDEGSGWSLSDAADAAILAESAGDKLGKARKARKAAKAAKLAAGAGKTGKLARLASFLRLNKLGSLAKTVGSGALTAASLGGGAIAKAAPWLAKGAGYLGSGAAAALGRSAAVLGGAGKLVGGAGRLVGSAGMRALAARGAVGAAGAAAGGAAGGTLGAIASAALGWPGLLVGLGVWGAWKGYKYLKSTKLEQMSRLRIVQYGFDPENKDQVNRILKFEDMIAPKVKISDDGKISLNHKDVDMDDVIELFAVDSKTGMQRFNEWYHSRFRPVLAANLLSLQEINKDSGKQVALTNAFKLEAPQKLKLVSKATANMDDAHNFMNGPSASMPVTKTDSDVKSLVARMVIEFDREQKDQGKPELSASSKIAQTAAVVGGNISGKEALERFNKNQALYKVVGKDGKEITGSDDEKAEAIAKGAATIQAAMALPKDLVYQDEGRVDALTAVRFKAYGLKTMEADKVKTLRLLEKMCEKALVWTGNKASIALRDEAIMQVAAANFGLLNTTGKVATEWRQWFNLRFCPAYLKYVTVAAELAKSQNLGVIRTTLTPQNQVEVANHIVATMTTSALGVRCRIWDITDTPWQGYILASNPDVTVGNIEALKELAKRVILGEVSTQATTDEEGRLKNTSFKDMAQTTDRSKSTNDSKLSSFISQNGPNEQGKGLMASGDTIVDGRAIVTGGEKALGGSGSPVEFTKLPGSTGDGWASNKQLILAAAKAAGVNPKLLASIIGMESGFKPNSLNKTTNAAGLGNFLPRTWKYVTEKYGAKYGITPNTSVFDARANALMTAEYIRENNAIIKAGIGRDMSSIDAYMAHFLGGAGLKNFLTSSKASIGAEVAPAAASANPAIFFQNAKTRTGARTVGEVISLFEKKMSGILPQFAINESEFGDNVEFAAEKVSDTIVETPMPGGVTQVSQTPSAFMQIASRAQGNSNGYTSSAGVGANYAPQYASSQPSTGAPGMQDVSGRQFAPPMYNSAFDNKLNAGQLASMPKGTMKVTLQREDSGKHGTFGIMTFEDGTKFHTMELAWLENKPRVSCIPAGQYMCKRRQSPKFGMPYEVMNVPGRSAILIHAGSFGGSKEAGMRADSAGCILLGMRRDANAPQPRIHDTKAAMELFNRITGNATLLLTILPSKGQMSTSVQAAVDEQAASAPAVNAPVSASASTESTETPKASSGISSVATSTSFAPSAPAAVAATENSGGYASSANSVAVRAARRAGVTENNYAPPPEVIRANARNNNNTAVTDGINKVNELLTKLVTVQEGSAASLEAIAKTTAEHLEVGKKMAAPGSKVENGNSPGGMPVSNKTPSRELKPNPVSMSRLR